MNDSANIIKKKLNKLSLSQRLKFTLITGFIVIALLGSIALVVISKSIEDHIFENQLQSIVNQYEGLPPAQQEKYSSINLMIYRSLAQVPSQFRSKLAELAPGIHDIEFSVHEEFHIAVVQTDNSPIYFFYDVYDLEISEESEIVILEITLGLFMLLLLALLVIFQSTVNKALKPMFELISQIKNTDGTTVNTFVNPGFAENDQEMGLLYRTLNEYSDRLSSFIEREREFTGFASHELRTPVTIIKGATELLELQQQPNTTKQIQRIKRATQEMEDMINVLLSLARERKETNIESAPIQQLFTDLIKTYLPRANKHNKNFICQGSISSNISVPSTHFNIAVENLLINAIKYSDGKNIDIKLSENSISICNNTDSQPKHIQGYGLGKIIIQRICEQQNWLFTLNESKQRLTATIKFTN